MIPHSTDSLFETWHYVLPEYGVLNDGACQSDICNIREQCAFIWANK
jgi:hypothetical protein